MSRHCIVLMYHDLASAQAPSEKTSGGDLTYVVDETAFRRQMKAVRLCNGPAGTLTQKQAAGKQSRTAKLVLTFDDGHISNYEKALPVLLEYGHRAHFFITTGFIGTRHHMSAPMIRKLAAQGMSIGSHTVSHPFLSDLPPESVRRELSVSKNVLEDITGQAVDQLSCPGGRISETVRQTARETGYRYLHTSTYGINTDWWPEKEEIKRIAIHAGTAMTEFENLIRGRLPLRRKALVAAAGTLKAWLGNARYVQFRDALFRLSSR